MQKKLGFISILLIFSGFFLLGSQDCLAAEAAVHFVDVYGEALLGKDAAAAEREAGENAKAKAVKKALGRFIAPTNESGSLYQQIIRNYKQYTVGNIKVIKKQNIKGKLYLISRVNVDFEKLGNDLKGGIKEKKAGVEENNVFFFVRVTGLTDVTAENSAQHDVLQRYNNSFQELGFTASDEDAVCDTMKRYCGQLYGDYVKSMENEIRNNVEVAIAVIGEIQVQPKEQDKDGCTVESIVHIKAVDFTNNMVISEFDDQYMLRRSNLKDAYKFSLEKAAFNSSKVLAGKTLAYWQKNKYE